VVDLTGTCHIPAALLSNEHHKAQNTPGFCVCILACACACYEMAKGAVANLGV